MLIPVILSGGAGTRLWPVSRKAHPKPFMRLADGQTLAGATLKRALDVIDHANVLTITARDYFFFTRDIYREVAPEARHAFVLEPEGRNTAAAIAAAALWVQDEFGAEARLLVLSADPRGDRLRIYPGRRPPGSRRCANRGICRKARCRNGATVFRKSPISLECRHVLFHRQGHTRGVGRTGAGYPGRRRGDVGRNCP